MKNQEQIRGNQMTILNASHVIFDCRFFQSSLLNCILVSIAASLLQEDEKRKR